MEQKNFSDQVDEWAGRLIVAIGAGKFREEVAVMLSYVNSDAFNRGVLAEKEAAKSLQKPRSERHAAVVP